MTLLHDTTPPPPVLARDVAEGPRAAVQQAHARLPALLDAFARRYGALRVANAPIDLTDAFWSDEAGRHVAPRSYGDIPQTRVMGYCAFGGAFIAKFAKDPDGRVLRIDGEPVIAPFALEHEVMACMCVHDLRNTSLYEISDALEGTHRLQGYRRWHLRKLNAAIGNVHPGFDPKRDSCFLFAGLPEAMRRRIALNALWLEQIATLGAAALTRMSAHESEVMAQVFPEALLSGEADTIMERSYMWARPIWVPASAAFLECKMAARRGLIQAARGFSSPVR
jgi:hypothetical protein